MELRHQERNVEEITLHNMLNDYYYSWLCAGYKEKRSKLDPHKQSRQKLFTNAHIPHPNPELWALIFTRVSPQQPLIEKDFHKIL